MIKKILVALMLLPTLVYAQINTERVMMIARNALYFEDYVLSIQYFNQVINAKPYLYEPYFFRGLAKINLDDFQGAEADCDKAIERNPFVALFYAPENVTLWHNLTLCHIQKKDYKAAEEDLGKLLAISPKYTRAYLMRGEVALKQQDTIRALNDFNTAIELDKYDPDAWSSRAIVQLQQSKYAEAESDFNQAIRLSARNAGI